MDTCTSNYMYVKHVRMCMYILSCLPQSQRPLQPCLHLHWPVDYQSHSYKQTKGGEKEEGRKKERQSAQADYNYIIIHVHVYTYVHTCTCTQLYTLYKQVNMNSTYVHVRSIIIYMYTCIYIEHIGFKPF